ncbi:MAG: NmrA family NAD(P)-binding protein [Fodinibius sp.]|nr:NmrA family NAD(P)-binding protein [Fodinibius sp.]
MLRISDYRDYSLPQESIEAIDLVLFILSSTIEGRVSQHQNVIQAAAEEDISQLFYTSMVHADEKLSPLTEDHAETEKLIKESGLPYSISRDIFYAKLLPLFMGNALESGQWAFLSGG